MGSYHTPYNQSPTAVPYPPPPPHVGVHADPQPLRGGNFAVPAGGYMMNRPPNPPQRLDYVQEQRVNVRIAANTWVVGVVVGILHVCAKFTPVAYVVEWDSTDRTGRHERQSREFSVEELRPYWPPASR
ncbi:hypothetical protein BJV78DRAFT_1362369 [Lactifluus subvellereus]|nr:hypothetical protein BJV78DRAFT_1362369 [Lactifluus subvellereus]